MAKTQVLNSITTSKAFRLAQNLALQGAPSKCITIVAEGTTSEASKNTHGTYR